MLVKGGKVLDALTACGTVAFDKTGTLTTGTLTCTSMSTPQGSSTAGGGDGLHGTGMCLPTSIGKSIVGVSGNYLC